MPILKTLVNRKSIGSIKTIPISIMFFFLGSCSSEGETIKANECEPPSIITRQAWKAKPANRSLMKKQKPLNIVIHHSGSKQNRKSSLEKKMLNLQTFSQKPGHVGLKKKPAWGDIPYHFYINNNGLIAEARDIRFAGDTNTGYDTKNKIQIVVEGNFQIENLTNQQKISLKKLICWLRVKYKLSKDKIYGHNEKARTVCPGKNLTKLLPKIIN